MTTQAECTALSPAVSKHIVEATGAEEATLLSASQALAFIGGGGSVGATNVAFYTAYGVACGTASMRAGNCGNSDDAATLHRAQKTFNDLAAGQ